MSMLSKYPDEIKTQAIEKVQNGILLIPNAYIIPWWHLSQVTPGKMKQFDPVPEHVPRDSVTDMPIFENFVPEGITLIYEVVYN